MTTDAKLNLYQKILKITEAIGTIEKTGKNSQQGYGFIEQAKVVAELRPQLAKWGVVIIPETISRTTDRFENAKGTVFIHANTVSRYTVINADDPADRFTSEWDGGEALDTSDKATNKAHTASQKTYLMKLFNISDRDDADAGSPPAQSPENRIVVGAGLATPEQKALIKNKLADLGVQPDEMRGYLTSEFGITDSEKMSNQDASMVIKMLVEAK